MANEKVYDVALSFAGEDRAYVEMVADGLRARGVRVFYDRYEEAELWGKDLYTHLASVYRDKAKYTVIFVSRHYSEKLWTKHERRAAQARAFAENVEYILPARFDNTEIEGIHQTVGYIDLRKNSPEHVCVLIAKKLGIENRIKADRVPTPLSAALHGEVTFDHTNHNGIFRIGEGLHLFETKWSRAGRDAVHCYNDPASIRGIALLPKGMLLNSVDDARKLDFTSRTRTVSEGRTVVIENVNGFIAIIDVIGVEDERGGGSRTILHFRYRILAEPSGSQTALAM